METSFKSVTLLLAIITMALSAGLFYAWTVSVIPGLKNMSNSSYLEAMQSINKAILNPGFFAIFFGPIILLGISIILQYRTDVNLTFWLMLAGSLCYLIGTVGVTVVGNVPMNDTLDLIELKELNTEEINAIRAWYEEKWNYLNSVRTIFAVLGFTAIITAIFYAK
ncbi:MAG: DUF1772 domain-containing protein [Flavobacteriales bacterium]|nr:DUF1772 domain-containing protein [Flavobacteriales bacterium]